MLVLALKVLLAPVLVVGSTLAGRRWGPAVAGTLVTLPVVAGPVLLVTRLEQGAAFGARAAEAALLGLVSLALFATVFARLSRRAGWVATLVASWAVVLVADVALAEVRVPAPLALVLVVAAASVGARLLPAAPHPAAAPDGVAAVAPAPPWWDLPARAVATAVLVLVVTGAAAGLGPSRTGVLAPFPIAISVVGAFVLAQRGPAAAVETMRGVLRGLGGFATFCCVVALLTPRAPVWVTFTVALAAALGVQAVVTLVATRRAARVTAAQPA